MTKELRVLNWCDPCGAEDQQELAETYTIEIWPETQPREIELCERHWKELGLPALLLALAAFGRAPGKPVAGSVARPAAKRAQPATRGLVDPAGPRHGMPPKGPRNLVCPQCPMTYASMGGLREHISNVHGMTMSAGEIRAAHAGG